MPPTVTLKHGTTARNNAFTGALGEVTLDVTLKQLRVHDGATMGGVAVPRAADITAINDQLTGLNAALAAINGV